MKINLNNFVLKIAQAEAGKKQVDIAQIKEVVRLTLNELSRERFFNRSGFERLWRERCEELELRTEHWWTFGSFIGRLFGR